MKAGPAEQWKDEWRKHLAAQGFKYFVLKADDFLQCLTGPQALDFNNFLKKHECWREQRGKKLNNAYWVCNRDEKWADEVRKLMEKHIGHPIGVPFDAASARLESKGGE